MLMIASIKGFIRLILFFVLSLCTVLLVLAGNILASLARSRWAVRWKNTVIRSWAWLTARLLNIKITIEGTPPKAPYILVSNHLSYMDVVPLWLSLNGTFIAKSEVKSWPFFGWATKVLGIIFIDRTLKRDVHRVNNLIRSTITEHQGVIIFPEGTSTKGETVLPFHPSLLKYPAQHEMPVHYATLRYQSLDSGKPASEYICWWGDRSFMEHFWELLQLPGFTVNVTFGSREIMSSDRKRLAEQLHRLVKDNFQPVQQARSKNTADRI